MAKSNGNKSAAAPAKSGRDRRHRSAATRKCLSRSNKILFAGAPKSILKAMAPHFRF